MGRAGQRRIRLRRTAFDPLSSTFHFFTPPKADLRRSIFPWAFYRQPSLRNQIKPRRLNLRAGIVYSSLNKAEIHPRKLWLRAGVTQHPCRVCRQMEMGMPEAMPRLRLSRITLRCYPHQPQPKVAVNNMLKITSAIIHQSSFFMVRSPQFCLSD
jgi:hypothetical protein